PLLALVLLAAGAISPAIAQTDIPRQSVDEALRAKLPEEIRASGELVSVNNGSFPPYDIVIDAKTFKGASADLGEAVGQMLGLKIRHETVSGLAAELTGIKAGRYHLALGPIGDFPDREAANDFVDFVQEYVIFAVRRGNPTGINELADTC